jgi:isocitrate lyase
MMEASLHTDVNETDHRIVDISKYAIDDLPRLITELEEVQNRFDAAAVNKSKLKKEYESCQTRLQAAVNVTQR